jgi:glycosyltransferase involved in cell wall biosynthesis
MPGYIPQAEQFLPAFDLFVMSSSTEGLGSIVLDAFAAGVPVASTAGGGLPELVRNGETGLLTPVGDPTALAQAILKLLADRSLAGRLSAQAGAWVREHFSVGVMADAYQRVYADVLGL